MAPPKKDKSNKKDDSLTTPTDLLGPLGTMGGTAEKTGGESLHKKLHGKASTTTTDETAKTDEVAVRVEGAVVTPQDKKIPAKKGGRKKVAGLKKPTKDGSVPPPSGPFKLPGEAFISYELKGGKPDMNFVLAKEARDFANDYKTMISKTHRFATHTRYTNHCNRRKKLHETSQTRRTVLAPQAAGSNAAVDRIVESMNQDRPVDAIVGSTKTNGNAKIATSFFGFKTQWGSKFWGIKAAMVASVLSNIAVINPAEDMTVQECMLNMTYGKTRDPDSGANAPLVVHYTPPGKKDVILIDVYTMYSFFLIPHETMATQAEEAEWLSDMTQKICVHIREVMSSPTFKSVLERTCHENFFAKLYATDRKSNLPKFLNGCAIRYKVCQHYTDHVVQDVANKIVDKMFECRLATRKYPDEQLDAEFELLAQDIEEEEEDEEEDDDDGAFSDGVPRGAIEAGEEL